MVDSEQNNPEKQEPKIKPDSETRQLSDLEKGALALHATYPRGKLSIETSKPIKTQYDLSLA